MSNKKEVKIINQVIVLTEEEYEKYKKKIKNGKVKIIIPEDE